METESICVCGSMNAECGKDAWFLTASNGLEDGF